MIIVVVRKIAETAKNESNLLKNLIQSSKGWDDDEEDDAPPKNGPSSGWGDEGKTSFHLPHAD